MKGRPPEKLSDFLTYKEMWGGELEALRRRPEQGLGQESKQPGKNWSARGNGISEAAGTHTELSEAAGT
eukprot:CAMPEP_0206452802 /NCGR_PEP_ID=MMETSP0324_2-20121206/20164_1 /ASSEMBLY_ACC=CAM_ASM_000836 /TAXON_ID=2866 /ORGANISM="Crypthecodinium cohnii, Strain Seligo" /LENGTH=68 /DNA_ID=CAMNT_0053922965 /DNA_START=74 /DNA_END=276 /DNA_ORIENTATION=-